MLIAIDGPAASGKGSIASMLSMHYDIPHLDTGLLYRKLAYIIEKKNIIDQTGKWHSQAPEVINLNVEDECLRTNNISSLASKVAANPSVRQALLKLQRDFANNQDGAILEGRDIGTVICPEADVKIFITASAETRAQRRHIQLKKMNMSSDADNSYEKILEDILERDMRDQNRDCAPLKCALDAYYLDTSDLDLDETFSLVKEHIDKC